MCRTTFIILVPPPPLGMGHWDTNGEIVQLTSSGHVALCGKWRFLRSSGE